MASLQGFTTGAVARPFSAKHLNHPAPTDDIILCMLTRLAMIGLLLTQPLRVCLAGACESVCRSEDQPTTCCKCCKGAWAVKVEPPCCRTAPEPTEPPCPCAFRPNGYPEPANRPGNPPSVNDQSPVTAIVLARTLGIDRPSLPVVPARWAGPCRSTPGNSRQASLCVWLN